ncbi:hypothetical protein [Secundilactobacillus kimchicus]|uniref:hypothetical protein n=1 Tax=Secundilactobacillus kimchicus TaxID=528209 RepID=UPI000AE2657D|nr:hypothetical protein [Secundilactobacillus kimchicus]
MKSRKLLIAIIISLMIGLVLGTLFAQHRQADYVKKTLRLLKHPDHFCPWLV